MKELRFDAADGVWYFAFASTPSAGDHPVRRQPVGGQPDSTGPDQEPVILFGIASLNERSSAVSGTPYAPWF
jgi:hypothetical protein